MLGDQREFEQVGNTATADEEEHSMPVVVSKLANRTLHLDILTQRRSLKLQQVLAGGAERDRLMMSRRLNRQTMAKGWGRSSMPPGVSLPGHHQYRPCFSAILAYATV